jgi:hypothetical protein
LRGHEAPGFAVLLVVAAAGSARWEKEQAFLFDLIDRDYVPDVDGDEVGDKHVDLPGCVERLLVATAVCLQIIVAVVIVASRLDLDTPQALAGIEDEVIAFAVTPGFDDSETEAGGFVEESEFENSPRRLGQRGPRTMGVFVPSEASALACWSRSRFARAMAV